MVASPHSLASAAGVDVLRAGGSAVDAAIAASAALAVQYPHMTGVGGDAFWLIHDAAEQHVHYLDGGGRAARSAQLGWFALRGHSEIRPRGVLPATLTVPGPVASWGAAHARCGRLPLARDLQAALGYARDGHPVTARVAGFIEDAAAQGAFNAAAARRGGRPPRAGAAGASGCQCERCRASAATGPLGRNPPGPRRPAGAPGCTERPCSVSQ
jgi:gamma-glutamyltranspeptidase/glutathione hydrolase